MIRPPVSPGDTATDEEREAFKQAVEEYVTKIRSARDTGDWTKVIIEGQVPTKFTLEQVDRNVWRELMDRAILPADSPRHIGQVTLNSLLFRLAVRAISGFDKFERLPDPRWDNWTMAPAALVSQLDSIDESIVGEIGAEVFRRLQGIRPHS